RIRAVRPEPSPSSHEPDPPPEIAWRSINSIRALSMDAVEKAQSGHPGTPMALAPAAYVLWTRFLRHNPGKSEWADRDRFVCTKDPRLPDVYYVEALAAPLTVNTLPPETFDAYRDHGDPAIRIQENVAAVLAGIEAKAGALAAQ
ncbi:MAG TPA: hypothetical protein VGP44_10415, partial [Gemmatimonadales bacterium]|nr:hypothetical protein [Gemmatimonadales bacterium]